MNFGEALTVIKAHVKVARSSWKDGRYIKYFSPLAHGFADAFEVDGIEKPLLPFIIMSTVDNMWVPWSPSNEDTIAEDWIAI